MCRHHAHGREDHLGPGRPLEPQAHLANQLHALPKSKLTAERLRPLLATCQPRVLAAAFSILDGRGAGQRACDAFRILRSLPPADPFTAFCNTQTYATIIMLTPGSARGVSTVSHLLMEMRARGIARSVEMYTAALSVCVRADRCATALQIFADMRAEGLQPDLQTYHILMDAYGQLRQWHSAITVLDTIVKQGVNVEWSYNMALVACGRAGRAVEAVQVFDRLLGAGMSPSLTTYTALMSLFCRAGALREAALVLDGMKAAGLQPNTITYSSLINGCEKAGSLHDALRYFDEMLAADCKPSVVTFNTLLRACARGRAWRLSVQLWHQMRHCGLHPDIVSVRAWITAMHASGCWPGVLLVLQQRLPRAVDKDPILQSKMCEALWSAGSTESRSAALALPGARVNMSRVDHTLAAAADGSGGGPAASAMPQPPPDTPLHVVSSWSVSTQQPGPAVASVALWLHSLATPYDWSVHNLSVASVFGADAAAAASLHAAVHACPPVSNLWSVQANAPACGDPYLQYLSQYPSGHLPRDQSQPLSTTAAAAALSASFMCHADSASEHAQHREAPRSAYHDAAPGPMPGPMPFLPYHPAEPEMHTGGHVLPWQCMPAAMPQFAAPKHHKMRVGYMPPQPRALAAPPDTAQILQLGLDLSQQEHMIAAVSATMEAAIEQYQWPLRLQQQGSTLRVSCNRAELFEWFDRGAFVLGITLPQPLDSQRTPDAVTAYLEHWMDAESTLRAVLAQDGSWAAPAPAPAAGWQAAAATVAGAAASVGLPPHAVVRALQLLTQLLAPQSAAAAAAQPSSPYDASAPASIVSLHATAADDMPQLVAGMSYLRVEHGEGPKEGMPPGDRLAPCSREQVHPSANDSANTNASTSTEVVHIGDGMNKPRQSVATGGDGSTGGGRSGGQHGSISSCASSSGRLCMTGCSGGGSSAGGGSREEGKDTDPARSHVITSVCIAHATAAAEKLVYDLRLPPEVNLPGEAASGALTLGPSMWQFFDLFLALTETQPSPTCAAITRFRDVHLLTLAYAPPLHQLPPSLTAAAAFTCARRCMNIAPEWPQVLIGATGHGLVRPPRARSRGSGGGAEEKTALGMACALVAETLHLPPFVPSMYQHVLAEGLDGMLRMEQRQNASESAVPIDELRRVLLRACLVATPGVHHSGAGESAPSHRV
eukprot:jgi/Ulvmu1/2389/UM130_0022.1